MKIYMHIDILDCPSIILYTNTPYIILISLLAPIHQFWVIGADQV